MFVLQQKYPVTLVLWQNDYLLLFFHAKFIELILLLSSTKLNEFSDLNASIMLLFMFAYI